MRKYIPLAVAVGLAALVVVADRALDISSGVTYGLAGFFVGLLIVAGPLFAFGVRRAPRPSGDVSSRSEPKTIAFGMIETHPNGAQGLRVEPETIEIS